MHFSPQILLFAGNLLAGTGTLANPIALEEESTHAALEPRVALIIFPIIWGALALLKDGFAAGGASVQLEFGAMAQSQPYKSKKTCRVELTANKNDKWGDWGVSS